MSGMPWEEYSQNSSKPWEKYSPISKKIDAPSNTAVAQNAANNTIASTVDAFLNFPVNAWNVAKAVPKMLQGEPLDMTQTPDFARRSMEYAGFIKPEKEPVTSNQRLLSSAIQGGVGALVNPARSLGQSAINLGIGAASGLASGATEEATGNSALASTVGMITPVAINSAANRARRITRELELEKRSNVVRDETLKEARDAGYVTPPAEINPSFINNRLESIAGKAAIKQEAGLRNQKITNKLAAQELNLPEGTPITEGVLVKYRDIVAEPYRELEKTTPVIRTVMDRWKSANANANAWYKYHDRSGHPDALTKAKEFTDESLRLQKIMDLAARQAGKPDLIDRLQNARTQIAKSYEIERALNIGDANVSAPVIGRALDNGKPLTGNLKIIGSFAEGPGRQFVGEGARIPTPGVSGMEMPSMIGYGAAGGLLSGSPTGVAMAGIPLIRGPVRSLLLSPQYQQIMANPNYSPGITNSLLNIIPQQSPQQLGLQSLLLGRSLADQQ